MKYAIISDIHSNLEALERVLEWCNSAGIKKYICLGDIVGYNANPVECLELIRNLDIVLMVRGNHDDYAASGEELIGFNPIAKAAIKWSRSCLNDEQKMWLIGHKLKSILPKESITIVHSTLDSPSSWGYIYDRHHAIDNFSYQYTKLCFCGHSHVPVMFKKCNINGNMHGEVAVIKMWEDITEKDSDISEIKIKLDRYDKYLINVGSIGQPRNGDPRASFSILDTRENSVSRICLKYDIKKAQKKILDIGLPEILANRLACGF